MKTESFLEEAQRMHRAWCRRNLDPETIALCERNGITVERGMGTEGEIATWGDWKWHHGHCVTEKELNLFLTLSPDYLGKEQLLREYIESYNLSIAPLNLLQKEGIRKFLPRLGLKPAPDPYGVQRVHSVVLRKEGDRMYYLSTHKPGYGSFLPILGRGAGRVYCPIGCAGCYRGPQTRFDEPLTVIHEDGRHQKVWIPDPDVQTRWLVEEWNTNQRFAHVYDVLFSGGEPMMLSNNTWGKILFECSRAQHLRCFRICTGALFLGFPFRFDDEFITLLTKFREETGVQVKLAVHVSHPEHVTPEAVFFARRLIRAGIELLTQCPLEPGVNFWVEDLDRTEQTLRRLDRLIACVVGVRPYKWILDMQGGVPLLSAIEVWRRVHDRHQGDSDITRPTSFALFLPQPEGNTNLSMHSLWAMEMEVDRERNIVRYRIPHPALKYVFYEEPIWPGINDDPARLEAMKAQVQ